MYVNMKYRPHIRVVEVNCPGWNLLAELEGPGFLKGVAVGGSDEREHYVKVKCDGTKLGKGLITASTDNSFENSGVTFDIPIENKIKVYGKDKPANTDDDVETFHRYWVTLTSGHQPVTTDDDDTDN